jgi:hypothetical protein
MNLFAQAIEKRAMELTGEEALILVSYEAMIADRFAAPEHADLVRILNRLVDACMTTLDEAEIEEAIAEGEYRASQEFAD